MQGVEAVRKKVEARLFQLDLSVLDEEHVVDRNLALKAVCAGQQERTMQARVVLHQKQFRVNDTDSQQHYKRKHNWTHLLPSRARNRHDLAPLRKISETRVNRECDMKHMLGSTCHNSDVHSNSL